MKWCVWQIQEDSGTKLLLKTTPEQPPQKVLTVSQTSRLLKRSQRQIYRYIRESRLTSYGKFLGEWLLNKEEVIRMASFPAHPHALPKSFRPLFPEYDLKDLNPGRDRVLVLSRLLEQGKEVAFITLGDPLLYSTYNYLLQALREKHPDLEVETVPGVSSISAAAALAGLPLAQGEERLAILPAPPDGEGLREVLARFDTVVVMKVGDRLPALRRALEELGLAGKAVLVSRAGLEGERVVRGLQSLKDDSVGYLSVVIIRRSEG